MRRALIVWWVALASCKVDVDFNEGRGYACAPDGGAEQCAPGWRCGLEGFCHREGEPRAWQCDSDSRCEAGWVCGLERTCHDPALASAYLCNDDAQCAARWRCGFEGRCVDPRLEISPITAQPIGSVEVLAPRLNLGSDAGPRFVTVDQGGRTTVLTTSGTEVRVMTPSDDPTQTTLKILDAGANVLGVVELADATWALTATEVVKWDNQARASVVFQRDGGPVSLRVASEAYLLRDGWLERLPVYQAIGFPYPLDPLTFEATVFGDCILDLSAKGMSSRNISSPDPLPLRLEGLDHAQCAGGRPDGIVSGRLTVKEGGLLALATVPMRRGGPDPLDAGTVDRNDLSVYDLSVLLQRAPAADGGELKSCETELCGPSRTARVLACRSPCDFGQLLSGFRPLRSASGVELEVECTSGYGQSTWLLSNGGEGCAVSLLDGVSSRYVEVRTPGLDAPTVANVMQFGEHGQAWVGQTFRQAEAVFLDQVPLGAVGLAQEDGGRLTAWMTPETMAVANRELGLVNLRGPEVVAVVEGTDDWVLGSNQLLFSLDDAWRGGAGAFVGGVDVALNAFTPPFHAMRVEQRGEATLIVTADDAIYAGSADPEQLAMREVPLRLVPQPAVAITSLAVLPEPSDGGTGLKGYVSTRTSVFSFATNRDAWTAQVVSMPPGTVREVWVEGGRARAGYEDGRVVTLPSRVPIAPEVSVGYVVDFVTACGQTWALTPLGLERLVDGEGEVGSWVEEPLPGAEEVLSDGLYGGHLFFHQGRVFVFNAFGNAASFEPGGCP